jgi:hypothetical protein
VVGVGGLRLKRGSEVWCGVQRKKEEWDGGVSLFAFFMRVQRELVFVKFCSVLSLFLSYYISLSFRCFCSNMCSEKRETSLVMPLQEDHIQSPKLPLDVLSC